MADDVWALLGEPPLFADRREAGRALSGVLEAKRIGEAVVVGLARGGVVVATEVARALELPLDALAVRKVGHPWQPEYAIGAVAPGAGVYVRGPDGLTDDQVAAAVEAATAKAAALDHRLHSQRAPVGLAGRTCLLVDDGVATGATMIAAIRWARDRRASRVVVAVPVGPAQTLELLGGEADAVICLHPLDPFVAVGLWYEEFGQVEDQDVVRLLASAREPVAAGVDSSRRV